MWKIIPFLLLFAAPVKADITSKLTSSVQLQVNAAATQVERIGTTYSVSGSGVDTTYTPTGGSAGSDGIGGLTISSGVGAIPALEVLRKQLVTASHLHNPLLKEMQLLQVLLVLEQ